MDKNNCSGSQWPAVERVMAAAIAARAFPGAVLLAGQGDRIFFHRAYGQADLFRRRPMTFDTVFDLASVTKPLATTLVAMHLAARGVLELDRPVADTLSEYFPAAAPRYTPRMLLSHTAGLAAWRPFFQTLARVPLSARRSLLLEMLSREPAISPPGSTTLYSDVGFLILAWLLEVLSGRPLAETLEKNIYPEMGGEGLFFPAISGSSGHHYAAGQLCPWRARLLTGVVDDENAFILGGAAGHAGLFGTALAVHRVVAALWQCFSGDIALSAFSPETVRAFLSPPAGGGRALGFDVPSGDQPSCGAYFSTPTIGHLGFTGVSFWLELTTGVHIVLLTNRTHPYRFAEGIKNFRPAIFDALMAAVRRSPGGLAAD
ncbi:MAG: serine hydrolase domain-containing protein [Pseudomonadota bacterium]